MKLWIKSFEEVSILVKRPNKKKLTYLISILVILSLFAGACGGGKAPFTPTPTRTPKPTFTPTPKSAAVQLPTAGSTKAPAATAGNQSTPVPSAPTATPVPPTPTPIPSPFAVVKAETLNVRSGPTTRHPIVGKVAKGDRLDIIGKNKQGTWWKVKLPNGKTGWVYAELVEASGNLKQVAVASAPPAPTPTPRPTPTPAPPTPTPAPRYEYNVAVVQKCEPNAGVTYVNGTVYRNHQPVDGVLVVFSYAPDGPFVVPPMPTGPHPGYPNWNHGYYSHIIDAHGARGGDWYFWIVDSNGKRISKIAHVHTDSTAGPGKCQQAVVDFDTN